MEPITISVRLTFWERYRLTAFLWFRAFRWFLLPVVPLMVIFLLLLAYVLIFPSPDHTFRQLMDSFGSAPYALLILISSFVGAPLLFTAISYSNPRSREVSEYTISENAVAIVHSVGNANLKWEAFPRAIETKQFFLLF